MPGMHYDIIADVHGCADELISALQRMSYCDTKRVWSHHNRPAILVGDFIDRGAEGHASPEREIASFPA